MPQMMAKLASRGKRLLARWRKASAGSKSVPVVANPEATWANKARENRIAPTSDEVLQEAARIRDGRLALNRTSAFKNLCRVSASFWRDNVKTDPNRIILVDLLTQDIRVSVRILTAANAIRRLEGATLVGLIHPDPAWERIVWDYYDAESLKALARGYGVTEFVNLAELGREVLDGAGHVTVNGVTIEVGAAELIDEDYLVTESDSAAKRILRRPIPDKADPDYIEIVRRSKAYARLYSAMFKSLNVLALLVSHVDYATWGFAVHSAMATDVPVLHVQSTGGLKAYAWFPENGRQGSYRAQVTQGIGEYFDEYIWPRRDELRRSAELTAHRVRSDYGRPAWWRASGQLAIHSEEDRWSARVITCTRFGLDPHKPIVAVFAHAMTDALGSNVEIFDDFIEWMEATAEFAAQKPEVNWLFLDHPNQFRYDVDGYFEGLGERYSSYAHMLFMPSLRLTKHELWSLADYAVTVRGSVSNEYPAFGIPAIQAGWSEWSHCGVSTLATSREDYAAHLELIVQGLSAGTLKMPEETVERARLWGWLYRGLSDVATPLVPHWNIGYTERMLTSLADSMRQQEVLGDPAFVAMARLWRRREVMLTRLDMTRPDWEESLGDVQERLDVPADRFAMNTAFGGRREPLRGDISITSGETDAFALMAGAFPGGRVVGRCDNWASTFGLLYDPRGEAVQASIAIVVDKTSSDWLKTRQLMIDEHREIEIWCQGRRRLDVLFEGEQAKTVEFTIPTEDLPGEGLILLKLIGKGEEDSPVAARNLVGLRIDRVTLTAPRPAETTDASGPATASA